MDSFHVLLVEDDPGDAFLTETAFKQGRVLAQVDRVENGLEALDYLRRQGAYQDASLPDLILLDLNMPRMSGREFLAEIKADPLLRRIPVVILTTSDVSTDIAVCYELGAAGYITKPVDMEQFFHAIRNLGDYWFSLVHLAKK